MDKSEISELNIIKHNYMRKLIMQQWLSLDGFAAEENGSTDFFAAAGDNKHSDKDIYEQMETIDTILLGANTYKLFIRYWPDADPKKEIIAERLNSTPKIVFSKSLKDAPWGKWPAAKLLNTDAVKKMKSEQGKDIVLWGSLSLSRSLMKAGLIDEYEFRIVPVALGKGQTFFSDAAGRVDFKTVEAKKYESGLVLLRYHQK